MKFYRSRLRWITCVLAIAFLGASPLPKIKEGGTFHHPTQDQYMSWVDSSFQGSEVWRFKDAQTFYRMVDASSAPAPLKQELKGRVLSDISYEDMLRWLPYKTLEAKAYVLLPKKLYTKIPHDLIESSYRQQAQEFELPISIAIQGSTPDEVRASLASVLGLPQPSSILVKNTVLIGDRSHLIVNPVTWEKLPWKFRGMIVDSLLSREWAQGLKLSIRIHDTSDLSAIARKFAGGRNPAPIEMFLRGKLGQKKSTHIRVQDLLHPFIQHILDSFADCHGPNCLNAALNVHRLPPFEVEHFTQAEFERDLFQKYRAVPPTESLQVGDLLAYARPDGTFVHASSYVGDGFVFTKNGLSRYSPYVFQKQITNESVYAVNRLHLFVFRISEGDAPVLRKPTVYRTIEPASTGISCRIAAIENQP